MGLPRAWDRSQINHPRNNRRDTYLVACVIHPTGPLVTPVQILERLFECPIKECRVFKVTL